MSIESSNIKLAKMTRLLEQKVNAAGNKLLEEIEQLNVQNFILEIKLEILKLNVIGLSIKEELRDLFAGHISSTILSEDFKSTIVKLLMSEGHRFHVPSSQLFVVFDRLINIKNVYLKEGGETGHFVFLFQLLVADRNYIEKFGLYKVL